MKVLVELYYIEYMSLGVQTEHRLIHNDEEGKRELLEYIDHMNKTWSGGQYEKRFKVLNKWESLKFIYSQDVNPDCIEELKLDLNLDPLEHYIQVGIKLGIHHKNLFKQMEEIDWMLEEKGITIEQLINTIN